MHSEIHDRLREARNYWLSTTRPDGRPHSMPIWGVWLDGALWFGTGLESVKGRNLARDPRAVVHLESGDDVVVLEGEAVRAESDSAYAAYGAKYDMEASAESFAALPQVGALYRFAPVVAYTWVESAFEDSRRTYQLQPDPR